jgi:hypothetical protein
VTISRKLRSAIHTKRKQLWIGLVQVGKLKNAEILKDRRGAYVNLITWASDSSEFRSKAELVFGSLGLFVADIEDPEPVSSRKQKFEIAEELEELILQAEVNPAAILYGTFHTWARDDA